MSLAQSILATDDMPAPEKVTVPEWNGATFFLHGLTSTERDKYESSFVVEEKKKGKTIRRTELDNARAKLVTLCARDAQGDLIFDEDDYIQLGKKSAIVLDRLYTIAARLSGLKEVDVETETGN